MWNIMYMSNISIINEILILLITCIVMFHVEQETIRTNVYSDVIHKVPNY